MKKRNERRIGIEREIKVIGNDASKVIEDVRNISRRE